jgi:hypothetical protein
VSNQAKPFIDIGNAAIDLGQKLEKSGIDVPLLKPIQEQVSKISGSS